MNFMKSILDFLVARWGLFFLAASAVILGGAYFFEYALGYQPCELCLYQRYPYMLIIVASTLAYFMRHKTDLSTKRAARGLLAIITVLFFLSAFVAAHQIGVEQGYWEAFTSCTGGDFQSIDQMPELSVSCDQTRTLFDSGLSFAEANVVLSFLLGLFGVYTMRKTR